MASFMAGFWGLIAGFIVWGLIGGWGSSTGMILGFITWALVTGALKGTWESSDRKKRQRQIEDEERLRVRIRKELADD